MSRLMLTSTPPVSEKCAAISLAVMLLQPVTTPIETWAHRSTGLERRKSRGVKSAGSITVPAEVGRGAAGPPGLGPGPAGGRWRTRAPARGAGRRGGRGDAGEGGGGKGGPHVGLVLGVAGDRSGGVSGVSGWRRRAASERGGGGRPPAT